MFQENMIQFGMNQELAIYWLREQIQLDSEIFSSIKLDSIVEFDTNTIIEDSKISFTLELDSLIEV